MPFWTDEQWAAHRDAQRRAYRRQLENNPLRFLNAALKKKYGLTRDALNVLIAQQAGACAICGIVPSDGKVLHVDHVHGTKHVRGMLCGTCNRGLGMFRDRSDLLRAAAEYLERATCRP